MTSWSRKSELLQWSRLLAAPGTLEAVPVPVLMLGTDHDKQVSWPAIAKAAVRLRDCELVHFGAEAHHEILREADTVRNRALAAVDAFLARFVAG